MRAKPASRKSAMAILAMPEHGQDARGTCAPPASWRKAKRQLRGRTPKASPPLEHTALVPEDVSGERQKDNSRGAAPRSGAQPPVSIERESSRGAAADLLFGFDFGCYAAMPENP